MLLKTKMSLNLILATYNIFSQNTYCHDTSSKNDSARTMNSRNNGTGQNSHSCKHLVSKLARNVNSIGKLVCIKKRQCNNCSMCPSTGVNKSPIVIPSSPHPPLPLQHLWCTSHCYTCVKVQKKKNKINQNKSNTINFFYHCSFCLKLKIFN